jgi:hypothetical protein
LRLVADLHHRQRLALRDLRDRLLGQQRRNGGRLHRVHAGPALHGGADLHHGVELDVLPM